MRAGRLLFVLSCIPLILSIRTQAIVIDTAENLIIPAGETHTLCSSHTYQNSVQIDGTLYIKSYDGTSDTGQLLLSAATLTIGPGGRICADGKGFGTSDGPGKGASSSDGGGGGYGGMGGDGILDSSTGKIGKGGISYGSIENPISLGSGGGSGYGGQSPGGSGGGCITIHVAGVLANNGAISANGSLGVYSSYYSSNGGGGSGGTVNIMAGTLSGAGSITANGGGSWMAANGDYGEGGGGSGGRIAIYCDTNDFHGAITSYGGTSNAGVGACGTIFEKCGESGTGHLLLGNGNERGAITPVLGSFDTVKIENYACALSSASFSPVELTVTNRGILISSGVVTADTLNLSNGATIYHEAGIFKINDTAIIGGHSVLFANQSITAANIIVSSGATITHSAKNPNFNLSITGNLSIESGGWICADGKGFGCGEGTGKGNAANNGSGAGYGGMGGDSLGAVGGFCYGSITNPVDLGSGGGLASYSEIPGGSGGGRIAIHVAGVLTNNGTISANGSRGVYSNYYSSGGGGGSGGTVNITACVLAGNGSITANGGDGGIEIEDAGGGSGGRIAVYYSQSSFTGIISANGGKFGVKAAQPGTISKPADTSDGINSTCSGSISFSDKADIVESVSKQSARIYANASGPISGTIEISTFSFVTIKSGPYANKGFCSGAWSARLDGVDYYGDISAFYYPDPQERKIHLKAIMDGVLGGAIDGYFIETIPGSNNYDQLKGTWSFCLSQINNIVSCGKVDVAGTVSYGAEVSFPETHIQQSRFQADGNLSGSYSGAIEATLTNVLIDDSNHTGNGEGFSLVSYQSNGLPGMGWGYCKNNGDGMIALKYVFDKPIAGMAYGYVLDEHENKKLFIVVQRLDLADEVSSDIRLRVMRPQFVSPGETITYTVEIANWGSRIENYLEAIFDLPVQARFISAGGQYYYELKWDDWVTYPTANDAPQSVTWVIPSISPRQVISYNIQAKVNWGLAAHSLISADFNVYHYDPSYYENNK